MTYRVTVVVIGLALLVVVTQAVPDQARATFPGENGLIAFERYSTETNQWNIFVLDPESGETRNVSRNNVEPGDMRPTWSPDGQWIAFVRNRTIFAANADGSEQFPLSAQFVDRPDDPAWSPDGCSIAFESFADGGSVFVLDLTTDTIRKVAHTGSYGLDGGPSWSPDGTRLVFENTGYLWLVNADGTALTQLSTTSGLTPSWSPDGSRIAFSSHSDIGRNNIAIATVGGATTVVTNNIDYSTDVPAWSPDGQRIAFMQGSIAPPFEASLYAMDPDGSNIEPLMSEGESGYWPDWQPVGGAATTCAVEPYVQQVPTPTIAPTISNPSELPDTGGNPNDRQTASGVPFAALIVVSALSVFAFGAAVLRKRCW